jgi:hypothetical protein
LSAHLRRSLSRSATAALRRFEPSALRKHRPFANGLASARMTFKRSPMNGRKGEKADFGQSCRRGSQEQVNAAERRTTFPFGGKANSLYVTPESVGGADVIQTQSAHRRKKRRRLVRQDLAAALEKQGTELAQARREQRV